MKFYQFLNEDKEKWKQLEKKLIEKCSPFLKDFKKSNTRNLLYIGKKQNINHYKRKKTRKNRDPLDTPEKIHEYFDKELYKRYGIKGRSECVFATADESEVQSYGNSYIILPTGKYKILWSPKIKDLWSKIEDELNILDIIKYGTLKNSESLIDNLADEYEEGDNEEGDNVENDWKGGNISASNEREYIEKRLKEIEKETQHEIDEILDSYQVGNLKKAIKSQNEIMIDCDYYFLIDFKYEKSILNLIKNEV